MFKYRSELVLSKSWLNRALIVQSYASSCAAQTQMQAELKADSEDVSVLQSALQDLQNAQHKFYLGQGGTSFRFFCFLVSRRPGVWVVKAHARLFERPQKSIQTVLDQFAVETQFHSDFVQITSTGWQVPFNVNVQAQESSQFVSALLLNAWGLPQDLNACVQKPVVSEDYLHMTLQMLKSCGMQMQVEETATEKKIVIARNQKPNLTSLQPEVDVSSAFSLCAAAVINGSVEILNWNPDSIQPDSVFLQIFDQMQIAYVQSPRTLQVEKQMRWQAVDINLNASPDLFPVLAVLCALADGVSNLCGAEQLRYKESDRLQKTKELLDLAGFQSELQKDGMKIFGLSSKQDKNQEIVFNPDHDHRMAMAAGLLQLAGYAIRIQTPEVVRKSYPTFWQDIGIHL